MISFTHELQQEEKICELERKKKNVYILQYNTPSSRNLMPLAAGVLLSYAKTDKRLVENFNFRIEMLRGKPDKVIERYHAPAIVALSLYFWNFRQSMEVAQRLKELYPEVLLLVGGPSAPLHELDTINFFAQHPYIDIAVAAEGELIFSEILTAYLDQADYASIPGISVRQPDGKVIYQKKRPYIKDLSILPSPFLDGTFDELMNRHSKDITGVVWETNRGCPFTCTFCFWGGPDSKVAQFPLHRVYAELDWISRNKIAYVFGADANFGILKRDVEIAEYMARLNRETGFPKYFVINWTKNATEKIFEVVDKLKESDIKFMMTTSIQSHNPDTLTAIKRQNIKIESFEAILTEAHKRNFHTYSELILGLPLESYATFAAGLRKVLVPELHYHFNVYCCVLIPGTEMAKPEYVSQYQIETRRCIMNLGKTVHIEDSVQEYEDLVVGTSTMPTVDWRRSHSLAYFLKALYGFRSAFFIINFLRKQYNIDPIELVEFAIYQAENNEELKTLRNALSLLAELQHSILNNGNETIAIPGIETSLHPEMASLIAFMSDKRSFYRELDSVIRTFANQKRLSLSETLYQEVLAYQFLRMPTWNDSCTSTTVQFTHSIHENMLNRGEILETPSVLTILPSPVCTTPDEFIKSHVYGGMIFSLREVGEQSSGVTTITAEEIYKKFISLETAFSLDNLSTGNPYEQSTVRQVERTPST